MSTPAAIASLLAARHAIDAALAALGATPTTATPPPSAPPSVLGLAPPSSTCPHPEKDRQPMSGFGEASTRFFCRKCGVKVTP
jgi:hypothetical protein